MHPGARERRDEPVVDAPESVVARVCYNHRPGSVFGMAVRKGLKQINYGCWQNIILAAGRIRSYALLTNKPYGGGRGQTRFVSATITDLEDARAGSGFRARVQGPVFRVRGAGCRVQGAGCRVQGAGFRLQGPGFRAYASEFRVQRVRCKVWGKE